MATAMVWQQQYPLDTTYYNQLMTAATDLYGAATRRRNMCALSSSALLRCLLPAGWLSCRPHCPSACMLWLSECFIAGFPCCGLSRACIAGGRVFFIQSR